MDGNGQIQNPSLQPCGEGISAVKALAIAQQQGQKVYTINPDNRATALPRLTIGGEVGIEIRNAIQAGKEVTFHEARINEHGWSGYGYSIVDPETGVGGYLIEGKGNGAYLMGEATGIGIGMTLVGFLPLVGGKLHIGKIGGFTKYMLAIVASFQLGLLIGWTGFDLLQGRGLASIECYLTGLVGGIISGIFLAIGSAFAFKGQIKGLIISVVLAWIEKATGFFVGNILKLRNPQECLNA